MPLSVVLKAISIILIILTSLCYAYQIIYLFVPLFRRKQPVSGPVHPHRYAVLIAARNEEAVIGHLLDSIHAQDYPADLVDTYVIADNCTDHTAQIAANHGARVFVRFNTHQIGKGYALSYLLDQLKNEDLLDQYDAFLIFDADNILKPDYITQINRVCDQGYPAFCGYRNCKNFGDSWISAGQGLWYLHDSTHLNRSRMLLGVTCAVSGTGFGFTRQLLEQLGGWHFFTLTEDIEFDTWCATRGVRIGYCHEAELFDEQPLTFRQSWRQRTRWVQGGIQVSFKYAKDLLRGFLKGGRTSYACLENATLSLWGYGMGVLCGLTSLLVAILELGSGALWLCLLKALGSTYLSLFAMGGLTLLAEHRNIRATRAQKLRSLFTFPLYMMTFVPIGICALFQKPQWKPIHHTAAISASDMLQK